MPASNLSSRQKYIKPMELAEQFSISRAQVYKLLARPEFEDAIFKPSEKTIRVNQDKAYEIMKQCFN